MCGEEAEQEDVDEAQVVERNTGSYHGMCAQGGGVTIMLMLFRNVFTSKLVV